MEKQEFVDLGISEEQAVKAAEASKKELEGYVPKHRFDEVNEAKKKVEKDLKEQTGNLETLKKSAGDNEDLQNQIKQLQEDAAEKEQQYQNDIKELRLSNAIKTAVSGKVLDEELVEGLFDKSKLILDEDGKVTGLEEQMKGLQESKSFLFKKEEEQQKPPAFHKVGGDPPSPQEGGNRLTLKEALAAKYSN